MNSALALLLLMDTLKKIPKPQRSISYRNCLVKICEIGNNTIIDLFARNVSDISCRYSDLDSVSATSHCRTSHCV